MIVDSGKGVRHHGDEEIEEEHTRKEHPQAHEKRAHDVIGGL